MTNFRFQATAYLRATGVLLMLPLFTDAASISCGAGDVQCLISAINQANANPQEKTIIRLTGGSYALTTIDNNTNGENGLPSIASTVLIDGGSSSATLVRAAGAPNFRILRVSANGRLTLNRITLSNGDSFGNGGALLNDGGVVTVVNSLFTGNDS